jgi:Lectin C-type domain
MALRRFDVGQGALVWFFAASVVLSSACSSDTDVSFDPPPTSTSGGDHSNGGTKLTSSGTNSGATDSGGSSAVAGGSTNAGTGNTTGGAQSQGGTNTDAGSSSGGTAGASTAGAGGKGSAGAGGKGGAGGMAGAGGKGGTGGAGAGGGGGAGAGGTSGAGGSGGSGGNSDCTPATFGGHSYYFCGKVDSATAAFTKCQGLGMSMVSVESKEENAFVLGKQLGSSWLGGTDQLVESEWRWTSSGALFWNGAAKGTQPNDGKIDGVYANFIVGQPNNTGDNVPENCLVITASGWNDLACGLPDFRATCEGVGPVIGPGPVLPNL